MDNRYHRTSNNNFTEDRQILGKEQIDWLINALTFSQATFKFIAIGGQVLSSGAVYENYATYPEERKYLLDKISNKLFFYIFQIILIFLALRLLII